MRYLYKRRCFIAVLTVWIILSALILPYSNSPEFITGEETPKLRLYKYHGHDTSIIMPRKQYQFNIGLDSNINSILSIFAVWQYVLVLQFALLVLTIDKRKQIIALIISHFVGSKYKDSFPALQHVV